MRKFWEIEQAGEVIETNYNRSADEDMFVTYRHYRDLDPSFFGEEIMPTGGITFCVVAEPDSEKLHVSFAECSSKDLYSKKIGRLISFTGLVSLLLLIGIVNVLLRKTSKITGTALGLCGIFLM